MGLINSIGVRLDPTLGYNFTINLLESSSSLVNAAVKSALLDTVVGGFSECSGLDMSLDVEEYREGGNNSAPLKFPTGVKYGNIVLKHGISVNSALWDWHFSFAQGKGTRRDGIITLLNDLHMPTHIWQFKRGLPVKYNGPTLHAGESKVAVESIEIAHEGLTMLPNVALGALGASAAVNVGVTGML